jgi:serine/threonine protein phosphatase PrpC
MESYLLTDVGDRENNEDSADILNTELGGEKVTVCILADGLGGHGKGEVASGLAIQAAKTVLSEADSTERLLENIIERAQSDILARQKEEHAEAAMKTTIVVLLISGRTARWAHVGDSRLYMFRSNKYHLRTLDHSIPQMLVLSGELKEKKIRNHPDRNKLLRVLGDEWDRVKYEVSEPTDLEDGDAFILCSDGFWENITEREMCKILRKKKSAKETLDLMSGIVQKRGKGKDLDNNTAVFARI